MDILLGCGHCRERRISCERNVFIDLCTVDCNPDVKPDVVWDMNNVPLPFSDNCAEKIHAYNVLEHCGTQGDYLFFFNQFSDFWRILKPYGKFMATVPAHNDIWALGDPGHTRVINYGTLSFLDQNMYEGCTCSMRTDYRNIYKGNFKTVYMNTDETGTFFFVLEAVK